MNFSSVVFEFHFLGDQTNLAVLGFFLGFCDVLTDEGFWVLLQEKINLCKMDENDVSTETQEISLDQEQRLPVSQKVDDLSTKIQVQF